MVDMTAAFVGFMALLMAVAVVVGGRIILAQKGTLKTIQQLEAQVRASEVEAARRKAQTTTEELHRQAAAIAEQAAQAAHEAQERVAKAVAQLSQQASYLGGTHLVLADPGQSSLFAPATVKVKVLSSPPYRVAPHLGGEWPDIQTLLDEAMAAGKATTGKRG